MPLRVNGVYFRVYVTGLSVIKFLTWLSRVSTCKKAFWVINILRERN